MLREPVRRDRIVTILPSGKVRPVPILRPPYSFPHVGRKRISEETGAARRSQLCRGPPHGFRRLQGFAFTSYCHDGARHAADHHVRRRCLYFHFSAASLVPTQVRGTGRGQGRRHGRRRRQRRGADAGRAAAGRRLTTTTTARPGVPLFLPSLLIATYAGATTVAPPGRAARERGRPALCANVLDEFVRAPLPRSTSRRAGRPAGSTPLRVRTVFFEAVMFLLHCYPHIVLLLIPRVVSSLPPALIRSSQSK